MFVTEILYRTLQEQESNLPLFTYLVNAIKILDLADKGYANFHLIFLIGFCRHLGFSPQNNYCLKNQYFDIENALFINKQPLHQHFIPPPASHYLSTVMECSFENMDKLRLNSTLRNTLVTGILDYYRFHVAGMGQFKSFSVLKEIF